jgi:predicted N-acetyltransferase YhbS
MKNRNEGPQLDNLHVKPHLKGLGIGSALFRASHRWVIDVARQELMPLCCSPDETELDTK